MNSPRRWRLSFQMDSGETIATGRYPGRSATGGGEPFGDPADHLADHLVPLGLVEDLVVEPGPDPEHAVRRAHAGHDVEARLHRRQRVLLAVHGQDRDGDRAE